MNREEAYRLVSAVLERYRGQGFETLQARVGTTTSEDVFGESKVRYTVDVSVGWADPRHNALEVLARIDTQSTFQFAPLVEKVHIARP